MKDHTAENLRALLANHPQLRSLELADLNVPAALRIEQTPSGFPTAVLRGTYLHSRYDPVKEAQRIVARQSERASGAVVLGIGLGYLAEAFVEQHPGRPLLIVEEDPALLLGAVSARDLRDLFSNSEVSFSIGEQAEAAAMKTESLPRHGLCILRRPALQDSPFYRRFDILLASARDRRTVNLNTLKRFGERWLRNLVSNLDVFLSSPGIRAAENLFTEIPALVLAAGPSLDAIAGQLASLRKRMLIVAVDTSYRFCRDAEPDFLVTVDPQYWNSRHLDWTPRGQALLVSESSTHPRTFRGDFTRECYFVSSFFPLGSYIESIIGQRGLIGAGGSVATTAWDLCRYLGCSPIYLAGLDLGFPEKRTHARGAYFEESMHIHSNRYLGAEQMTFRYLHQAQPTAVENNSAGRTLTDRRMLIYKAWFENQLSQQTGKGGAETYTLSAEGVAIAGISFTELGSALQLPEIRPHIDSVVARMRRRGAEMARRQNPELVFKQLEDLGVDLKRLEKLATEGLGLIDSSGITREELLPALEDVDRRILKLASRQIAGFLFQPLIHDILENPEGSASYEAALETSRRLYSQMAISAAYHRRLLSRCAGRLQIPGSTPGTEAKSR